MVISVRLITSIEQLMENIRRYAASVEELADLMAYCRSWYALNTGDGWLLAPSKFIGYEGMNSKTYRREKNHLDGRATEKLLEQWSDLIEEGHPQHDELHAALAVLFAHYGKTKNTLARISIVRADGKPAAPPPADDLVRLLVAVYRGLSPVQRAAFRMAALTEQMQDKR